MALRLLWIGLGGAAGSILRYLINLALHGGPGSGFPLATLLINVGGCGAIGFVMGLLPANSDLRLALTIGVLGGFTTFSSFGWETVALLRNGQAGAAMLYVGLSVALGLAAVWPGFMLGQRLAGE